MAFPPFTQVSPGDGTLAIRLWKRCRFPLSHLSPPSHVISLARTSPVPTPGKRAKMLLVRRRGLEADEPGSDQSQVEGSLPINLSRQMACVHISCMYASFVFLAHVCAHPACVCVTRGNLSEPHFTSSSRLWNQEDDKTWHPGAGT